MIRWDLGRASATCVDVPARYEDLPLLWTVPELLSPNECDQLVSFTESAAAHPYGTRSDDGERDRIARDDPALARLLFARLEPALPQRMGDLALVGLNERMRLYRYGPGQRLSSHFDYWYRRTDRQVTLLTVLVYLNDDFAGGETDFEDPRCAERLTPRKGHAAVWQHHVRHKACPVLHGVKYALRTDALYEASGPIRSVGGELVR